MSESEMIVRINLKNGRFYRTYTPPYDTIDPEKKNLAVSWASADRAPKLCIKRIALEESEDGGSEFFELFVCQLKKSCVLLHGQKQPDAAPDFEEDENGQHFVIRIAADAVDETISMAADLDSWRKAVAESIALEEETEEEPAPAASSTAPASTAPS